jgi:putative FmdB family regulatory protein
MPIYEYRCEKCGTLNEALLLPKKENPSYTACGGTRLTKLMSAPNFSIKGNNSPFGTPPEGCCGSADMCGGAAARKSRAMLLRMTPLAGRATQP